MTEARAVSDGVDLKALIERVMEAKGPDRELDLCIEALAVRHYVAIETIGNAVHANRGDGTGSVIGWIDPGRHNRWFSAIDGWDGTPEYTASIDSALGLVARLLPDSGWAVTGGHMNAKCTLWPFSDKGTEIVGEAETTETAILLALLTSLSEDTTHAK